MMLKPSKNLSSDHHISEADLYQSFSSFSIRNNFEYFIIFKIPDIDDKNLADITLFSNWPDYLVKQYDQARLLEISPIIDQLSNSQDIVLYDIDTILNSPINNETSRVLELFKSSGLRNNVGLHIETNRGERGAVLFTTHSAQSGTPDLKSLKSYTTKVFGDLMALDQCKSKKDTRLSRREHECVLWTSQGKTSYEIGMILGLSENTINNYLVSAGRKLAAVNRPHMVAKALRENLIQ